MARHHYQTTSQLEKYNLYYERLPLVSKNKIVRRLNRGLAKLKLAP